MSPARKLGLAAAALLWLTASAWGALTAFYYERLSAPLDTPAEHWPANSSIEQTPGSYTLVMTVHPHCPCTRASITELNRLLQRYPGRLQALALVVKPFEVPDLWAESDLTRRLRQLPATQVRRDFGGSLSAAFGANISGQVLLYDAHGRLAYDGGLTAFRGHEGPNEGQARIAALLQGQAPPRLALHGKAFGCSIKEKNCDYHDPSGGTHADTRKL